MEHNREIYGKEEKIVGDIIYPSIEEVEQADREQLARWYRFLESPGSSAIKVKNYSRKSTREEDERFNKIYVEEAQIMNRIIHRFEEAGGFTPEISKKIDFANSV